MLIWKMKILYQQIYKHTYEKKKKKKLTKTILAPIQWLQVFKENFDYNNWFSLVNSSNLLVMLTV